MSARCEPPEELRGVDGWHWVQIADWPATVNRWVWDAHEGIGFWHPHISERTRYVAPVMQPDEADVLRGEANEWCQKAQLFEDRTTRLGAELAAAREAIKRLLNAMEGECAMAMSRADLHRRRAREDLHQSEENHQDGRWHAAHDLLDWVERTRAALGDPA